MISPVIWLALGLSAAFCCACWYFLRWSLPRRPEDEVKTAEKELQKQHDESITKLDALLKVKEAEVMEV